MRLGIVGLTLVLFVVLPSTALADAPFTWSAPQIAMQRLPATPVQLRSVDCPAATLCVAVDEAGNVLTSSAPTGPESAWTVSPVTVRELTAVSCPSTTLCVAVGSRGELVTSTNPAGGSSAWTAATVDGGRRLEAVSCASASLCVAVDGEGNVVTSTQPAAGAASWTAAALTGAPPLTAVDCPKADLCVAVDSSGRAMTSVNPAGGAATWSVPSAVGPGNPYLQDVSCFAGSAACRAVDYFGKLYTTTDAVAGVWAASTIDATGYPVAISCVSPRCAVVDLSGNVVAEKSGGYVAQNVTAYVLEDVSCPTTALCVAVTRDGSMVSSTNPFQDGTTTWQSVRVDVANNLLKISCAGETFCLTIDQRASAAVSGNPGGSAPVWAASVTGNTPSGLSCPTPTLCVASNFSGDVITSTDPGAGAAAWTYTELGNTPLGAVSCPSTTLCVVAAGVGKLLWSTDPTGGAAAWHLATISGGAAFPIRDVSCPEPGFCVAVSDTSVLVSADPAGGAASWSEAPVAGISFASVACASRTLCVAAGGAQVATSTNPLAGSGSWTVADLGPPYVQFSAIDCAEPATCVAADYNGRIAMTSQPTAGASAWTISEVAGTHTINDINCPTRKLCVAVDKFGYAIVGTGVPDPVIPEPPSNPPPAPQPPAPQPPAAPISQQRDTTAPQTSRLRSKISRKQRTARFTFRGADPGAPAGATVRFQCRLDKGRYGACRSPRSYRRLRRGRHTFSVRAVDAAGNVDRTPARLRFRI